MLANAVVQATSARRMVLRFAQPELSALRDLVFRRHPRDEWATLAWFGWRELAPATTGADAALMLTYAAIESPKSGDLDDAVSHVAIDEPYSLRMALAAEHNALAPGVIHSHPQDVPPIASVIDDDMDAYYSRYFSDFAPGRPYVSLIFTIIDGAFACSGRVWWRGAWHYVTETLGETQSLQTWVGWRPPPRLPPDLRAAPTASTARLAAAFGDEAALRLKGATVAVIGAGGTGSAAIEVLARAGVGRLVLADPDRLDESNLERVHGSTAEMLHQPKVVLAKRHVADIAPNCVVDAIIGALPQDDVVDAISAAHFILCCTDSHSSRLAVSDIAVRYLVPALDCGVTMEGKGGTVRGQIVQLVRLFPHDPCALCREMTIPWRVAQELMSEEEKSRRRAAARQAQARGESGNMYWHDEPQLNTVGYLTTTAGAMAAGYAIGLITGRFAPPFSRLQMNLVAPLLDSTDVDVEPRADCTCRRVRGHADQALADAYVWPPSHWSPPRRA
jgi:tRNA A37 threonylcarbamoyladenosine dehydratase